MKKSKFSDALKAFILMQDEERVAVAEICRKAGISQITYFNWKKMFSGMFAILREEAAGFGREYPPAQDTGCGSFFGQAHVTEPYSRCALSSGLMKFGI